MAIAVTAEGVPGMAMALEILVLPVLLRCGGFVPAPEGAYIMTNYLDGRAARAARALL